MIRFTLEGWAEKVAPQTDSSDSCLLYHQVRTREALRLYEIVLNTYNTGTGKTRAAHQRLIDLNGSDVNVLIIAPTNELIRQHVRDVEDFVEQHDLQYRVLQVNAPELRALESKLRNGETLYRLLTNARTFDPDAEPLRQTIVVTNPDIFYLGLYMRYGQHDRRNVFAGLLGFDYIIIDEFHYYSSKQAAAFLFALTLYDAWGYFSERKRRICLLSATPRSGIIQALRQLFGERLAVISPENESADSSAYDTLPALAPLEVSIESAELAEWVSSHTGQIERWTTQDGLDGAIISGSLARINQVYDMLRHLGEAVQRLTGPEPTDARSRAAQAHLILATPTVDLGYNFVKHNKPERQNLDYVICEAQYRDELVQRIGRAGRVLGKQNTAIPSQAVVLVNDETAQALRALDGKRLSRAAFAEYLENVTSLPVKHQLDSYQVRYALQEAAYPLYQFSLMLTDADRSILTETFERFKAIIAPNSRYSLDHFKGTYKKYEKRQRWLTEFRDTRRSQDELPAETAIMIADWAESWDDSRPNIDAIKPKLHQVWRRTQMNVTAFVESQVELIKALFHFRDSFEGPSIAFHDPQRWFSSEPVGVYSAIHLLSHYQLRLLQDRRELNRYYPSAPEADFYAVLENQHRPAASIHFTCHTPLDHKTFQERCAWRPVALRGLRLASDSIPIDPGINEWLEDRIYTSLIIPPEGNLEARVRGRLRHSPLWPRRLSVMCEADESLKAHEGYLIFLGTAAFEAHAALIGLLYSHDRSKDDPIIC